MKSFRGFSVVQKYIIPLLLKNSFAGDILESYTSNLCKENSWPAKKKVVLK